MVRSRIKMSGFSIDHDVLTKQGWKAASDITIEDELATYSHPIKFVKPLAVSFRDCTSDDKILFAVGKYANILAEPTLCILNGNTMFPLSNVLSQRVTNFTILPESGPKMRIMPIVYKHIDAAKDAIAKAFIHAGQAAIYDVILEYNVQSYVVRYMLKDPYINMDTDPEAYATVLDKATGCCVTTVVMPDDLPICIMRHGKCAWVSCAHTATVTDVKDKPT